NVVGSVFSLNLGAPAAAGGHNTGLSNGNTLGNRASGFAINATAGGTFILDPITTVAVDANPADFVSGSYSYLIGTVPAGSSGAVTNLGNFTFANAGSDFSASVVFADFLVSNGSVYLNFTVAPVPEPVSTGLIVAVGLAAGAALRRKFR